MCHAVIDKVAPGCPVVDLSHGIPPLDVSAGALLLADSLPFIRHDAIVLAVVDPSVGRDRDIAVEADDGRLFVGPDNGLLSLAWRARDGVRSAVSITSSSILHEPVSASFHARDVLAPAAAHLALGTPLADRDLRSRRIRWPSCAWPSLWSSRGRSRARCRTSTGSAACTRDVQLNVRSSQLVAAGLDRADRILVETPAGGSAVASPVVTYADLSSGEWGLMVDPRGWLSVICGNPVGAHVMLGACNPQLAHEALSSEPDLGTLLPCNVVVYERDGRTHISAIEAERMLSIVGNDTLQPIATKVREKLAGVVERAAVAE